MIATDKKSDGSLWSGVRRAYQDEMQMQCRNGERNHVGPQKFSLAPPAPSPLTSFSPQPSGVQSNSNGTACEAEVIANQINSFCLSSARRLRGSGKRVEGARGRREKHLGALWGFSRLPRIAFSFLQSNRLKPFCQQIACARPKSFSISRGCEPCSAT